MENKKGMEFAVSTLVGIILGALMLLAGLFLLVNVMLGVTETYEEIFLRLREEIDRDYDWGKPIYIHRASAMHRDTETAVFGVALKNIHGVTKDFKVELVYDEDVFHSAEEKVDFLLSSGEDIVTLNPSEKEIFFILAPTKNLPRGQNPITLNVSYKNESGDFVQYDTPKMLYVNK